MDTLGRESDLTKNLQVLVKMQGQTRYLHYQNPYFAQPGWNHKYRQIPWMRSPWPAGVVPPGSVPDRVYTEKEITAARARIKKRLESGDQSLDQADFRIMDSPILAGGPNTAGYTATVQRHAYMFGSAGSGAAPKGSVPQQQATPSNVNNYGPGGMNAQTSATARGSFRPNKKLLIAAVVMWVLNLLLDAMGARYFHGLNPLHLIYSITSYWPLCLLAVLGSMYLNYRKGKGV
jgi:hypothetical protein